MGYPTYTFKSPLVYNPWFEKNGVDAIVVPMGVKGKDYPAFFRSVFTLTNIRGALVTMPHKVITMELVDEVSPIADIAGACNAVLPREDGSLYAQTPVLFHRFPVPFQGHLQACVQRGSGRALSRRDLRRGATPSRVAEPFDRMSGRHTLPHPEARLAACPRGGSQSARHRRIPDHHSATLSV